MNIPELEKAYKEATPGAWHDWVRYEPAHSYNVGCGGVGVFSTEYARGNAAFIALSHNMMPDLLKAVHLLKAKMNPLTNDQATHDEALALLSRLAA